MNTHILHKIGFFLLASLLLIGCSDDTKDFDNRVYFTNKSNVNQIQFKSDSKDNEQLIRSAMAKPEDSNIVIRYAVDNSRVSTYNEAYYDRAILLDSKYYLLDNQEDIINKGSVESNGIKLTFKNIASLNIDSTYVLPIVISQSSISSLWGQNIQYYVLKGGSLIDVVPSLTNNYFVGNDELNMPVALNDLKQLTIEGLVYANTFSNQGKSFISTLLGIEGEFLLRFGDAGFPLDQLQIATKSGNFPQADPSKTLPTGKWFHFAATFDGNNNGKVQIYINGKLQSQGNIDELASVNLGRGGIDGLQIGRSYEDSRFLDGMVSELRIWNRVRSVQEIENNFYSIDPKTQGLVAYWKCNEGVGNVVKDFTANGNNLHSENKEGVSWIPVTLPAK